MCLVLLIHDTDDTATDADGVRLIIVNACNVFI